MATPTEQNPVTATSSKDGVQVIAIKLPFDLQQRLLSFPFIHQIHEYYPTADIHFITPKKEIEVLNLLPFKAYYHEFDEDEIKSVFDVHRFTVNSKIFNVDLFINLTNSFADACLGLGLRAPKRLGFSDGWKTLVLNIKTPRPVGHHITEDFFALFKELTGSEVTKKMKVMSRNLNPIVTEWEGESYIAINLSPVRQGCIEEEIFELINLFEHQNIVLFSSDDQDKVSLLMDPFMARLSKKNKYFHFQFPSWIELARMLAYSRGVITFNGPLATIAAYAGARTVVLYDSENPQIMGPFYFLSEVLILGVNDPTLAHSLQSSGSLRERKRFNMQEVFSKVFDFFKLVID